MAEAIMITSIYLIIRVGASGNQFVTITILRLIGILAGVILKLGIQSAIDTIEASQKISELGNLLSVSIGMTSNFSSRAIR